MSKIIPEGYTVEKTGGELELTSAKKTAMVKKAKELFDEPIEEGKLADLLEQYYITENNEHYTSAQLKEVVDKVADDLKPEVVEEVE